jgi:GDPmannose 4,6-dehydratase
LEKDYEVYGADRRSWAGSNWRMAELGIVDKLQILFMDLLEITNIMRTIESIKPDEVYNLAAQSFVSPSFEQPMVTTEINANGVLRLLEAIRAYTTQAKFYQAFTNEMFGKVQETPQTEKTLFYPRSPYGIAKLYSHWITINYREAYNMFACSGILFNHESPLRGLEFVTRKITNGIARIKYGLQDKIVLGNLDAKRDWGFAGDYVEGMWLMLQQDKPDDYLLATGETHSVKEFADIGFQTAGYTVEWHGEAENTKGIDKKTGKVLVEVSKEFYRPAEVDVLTGNPQKATKKLGWKPAAKFSKLVELMVTADLHRVEQGLL